MKPNLKKRWPSGADLDGLKASLLAKLGPNAHMDCEVDAQGYTCVEVGYKPKVKHKPKKPRRPKLIPGEYIESLDDE